MDLRCAISSPDVRFIALATYTTVVGSVYTLEMSLATLTTLTIKFPDQPDYN